MYGLAVMLFVATLNIWQILMRFGLYDILQQHYAGQSQLLVCLLMNVNGTQISCWVHFRKHSSHFINQFHSKHFLVFLDITVNSHLCTTLLSRRARWSLSWKCLCKWNIELWKCAFFFFKCFQKCNDLRFCTFTETSWNFTLFQNVLSRMTTAYPCF